MPGFDYSKWDNLELSDDEDHHPGAQFIEANTLRRIKREAHENKEKERLDKIESLEKQIRKNERKIKTLSEEDPAANEAEIATLTSANETFQSEVDTERRQKKFNAEEAVRDAWSHSLVGAACKPDAGPEKLDYETFAKKYGDQLDGLAVKDFGSGYEEMGDYFRDNSHLLTEHAMGYMLLKCLYMVPGFDYSKWDNLELSDDEDHHPGAQFIEANTLRRIKREAHENKEKERLDKIESLEKQIRKNERKIKTLSEEDPAANEAEIATLTSANETFQSEVDTERRQKKFNAEEAVRDAWSHSLVGAACKPDAGPEKLDYETFAKKYGDQLDGLAVKDFGSGYEEMGDYFRDNSHLLTEHAMGYMLLKCLYMEMEGNTLGMRRGARAGYALKSIVDFAEASKRSMKDAAPAFFIRMNDVEVAKEYEKMYEDYVDKLQNRAVEKKKEEAVAAAEEATRTLQIKGEDTALEDVPREERLGPGGLDPVEVFESLPTAMQEAFESGSIDKLREYVNGLPMEDAKRHMKRMVDSGLWVPAAGEDPGLALR